MTPDRIDLDDLEVDEEADPTETPNRGDWFWRGEGDPDAEPDDEEAWASAGGSRTEASTSGGGEEADSDADASARTVDAGEGTDADAGGGDADYRPAPRVPGRTDGAPVGIPVRQGGAGGGESASGGGPGGAESRESEGGGRESGADGGRVDETRGGDPPSEAAGPRGGGTDDMTLAFTYGAITRLADPRAAVADAEGWTDWIGVVGEVGAHVINKFQRDHRVDADFFSGSGTGPGERLAEIDEHSMFHADRMVVVGVAGEDEPVAEAAGWEFVPLEEAAGEAGWALRE